MNNETYIHIDKLSNALGANNKHDIVKRYLDEHREMYIESYITKVVGENIRQSVENTMNSYTFDFYI